MIGDVESEDVSIKDLKVSCLFNGIDLLYFVFWCEQDGESDTKHFHEVDCSSV